MGTQIWEVEFGNNVATYSVTAISAKDAIQKAEVAYQKEIKEEPEDFWVSKVKLVAETDK